MIGFFIPPLIPPCPILSQCLQGRHQWARFPAATRIKPHWVSAKVRPKGARWESAGDKPKDKTNLDIGHTHAQRVIPQAWTRRGGLLDGQSSHRKLINKKNEKETSADTTRVMRLDIKRWLTIRRLIKQTLFIINQHWPHVKKNVGPTSTQMWLWDGGGG